MSEAVEIAGARTRSRGGLAEEVCRKIADDIVLGRFQPNSRLDENTLAEMFGVSRTPVREALKQLAIMGLVDYRPNRGAIVAEMTAEQLDQLFEAIGELEAACARHAALRMTDDERASLCELHAQGRAAMQAGDMDSYDSLNRQLHAAIIQGAHNPVLSEMTVHLRNRAAPFRRSQFHNIERIGESFEEHSYILDAILARDAALAHRHMRLHLLSARKAVFHSLP
ncbi:GntR family transcriptional regulator [Noviherbaspirillum sedimenti]|uniref:GntR family transcriptional regulator n=1 Tax=Noviherbaspirillum sedimenti TaxID=2320865 RepID=A0A3A3FZA9_9BURK|nr:GntR family transcriptional regulator [Noviherbaspirillum sedimenti]RJG01548.1 GntR family transcriptional regulator [Noviherbaspirillum sedimenti]